LFEEVCDEDEDEEESRWKEEEMSERSCCSNEPISVLSTLVSTSGLTTQGRRVRERMMASRVQTANILVEERFQRGRDLAFKPNDLQENRKIKMMMERKNNKREKHLNLGDGFRKFRRVCSRKTDNGRILNHWRRTKKKDKKTTKKRER
jgi:hypothetical protein